MRPLELELVGFSAYRDREVVDFRDADLFALVGATGSGKSSLIDAICFALYGTVPRYEDRRVVAPVITQGATEARVRFTFAVGDAEHTAVRVVRRTATGASTREARLVAADGTVLAGTADELTAAVTALLGLPFEHFTRCVVLPQGEFARFLHDSPADRQQLLARLLDLGLYERVRTLATERRARAEGQATQLQARLDGELAAATPEAQADAAARVEELGAVRADVAAALPELDALAYARRQHDDVLRQAGATLEALRAVVVPPTVAGLAAGQRDAAAARADADDHAATLAATVTAAEARRAALGDAAELRATLAAHAELAAARADETSAAAALAERRTVADEAAGVLAAAEQHVLAAADAARAAEHAQLAHVLAADLRPGDPCPVCQVPVATLLPAPVDAPSLEAPRRALAEAGAARDAARSRHERAQAALVRADAEAEARTAAVAALVERLAGAPAPDALAEALGAVQAAEAALDAARAEAKAHQRVQAAAREAERRAGEAVQAARRAFTTARDPLVAAGAPAPGGDDLLADWTELATWAGEQATALDATLATRRAERDDVVRRRAELVAAVLARCTGAGIDPGSAPGEAVATALAHAEAEQARLATLAAAAATARAALEVARHERAVAHELAQHLSARGFERWLLDEALGTLLEGASEVLAGLTDGQYALEVDPNGTFVVVDHHNAGERRLARTLSGGETFLASLSLALALADQLAGLAAEGASRVEALFLDEGFGSLDGDTLDAVATAIEHLGAGGRIVGLVTHVRELAERIPVRFEVTKDERSAHVQRVLA